MNKNNLPTEVEWSPADEVEANKCFQMYAEYSSKKKTVMQLATETLETSAHIRRRIKWASLVHKKETEEGDVAKQLSDSALISYIKKLDTVIEKTEDEMAAVEEHNRKVLEGETEGMKYIKGPSLRDYISLMRERRLAEMDLARVRGVLDFRGEKGNNTQVNVILPQINHGEGTQAVIKEVKGDAER